MKNKVSIINLGCPRNLVDSETLLYYIQKSNFEVEESMEKAEVGIVNTCAFINEAKEESIEVIFQAVELKESKNLKYLIVVGCMVQRYHYELSQQIEQIDAVVSPKYYKEIDNILREVIKGKKLYKVGDPGVRDSFFGKRIPLTPRDFTYLKISEGCNNRCSYCTIPSIRGNYKSRSKRSLLQEIGFMHSKVPQLKEINLVGQDTTLYKDDESYFLEDLIKDISNYEFVKWIRILYTHPEHFREELMKEIAENPKVCKYVDLPIQHISNKILKLMNRSTTKTQIMDLIEKIRNQIPGVAIRTTLMVGFPQEEEKDFMQLVELVKEIKFEKLGIFLYSEEEGTEAYNFNGKVNRQKKLERFKYLMQVQKEISKNKLKDFIGKEIEVLVDDIGEQHCIGRTKFDAPEVDGQVFIKGNKFEIGDLEKVRITDTLEYDLLAEEVKK